MYSLNKLGLFLSFKVAKQWAHSHSVNGISTTGLLFPVRPRPFQHLQLTLIPTQPRRAPAHPPRPQLRRCPARRSQGTRRVILCAAPRVLGRLGPGPLSPFRLRGLPPPPLGHFLPINSVSGDGLRLRVARLGWFRKRCAVNAVPRHPGSPASGHTEPGSGRRPRRELAAPRSVVAPPRPAPRGSSGPRERGARRVRGVQPVTAPPRAPAAGGHPPRAPREPRQPGPARASPPPPGKILASDPMARHQQLRGVGWGGGSGPVLGAARRAAQKKKGKGRKGRGVLRGDPPTPAGPRWPLQGTPALTARPGVGDSIY